MKQPTPYEETQRVNAEIDAWAQILEIEVNDFEEVPILVPYNQHAFIDTKSGLLYDRVTLQVVGHDNY